MKNRLNRKQRRFCTLVSAAYSPSEAAARAGFDGKASDAADELLENKEVISLIRRLNAEELCRTGEAEAGLRRLAFGSCTDAIRLCFCERLPDDLDKYDLFNVAEFKHTEKGTEVKFFDRQKALDALGCIASNSAESAEPFYRALKDGARMLEMNDE